MGRVGVVVAVVALALGAQAHTSGSKQRAHRVVRGDTLGELAARYGVSAADLARANDIRRPDHIRTGQRLVVPAGASAAPPPADLPSTVLVVGDGGASHQVALGETLGGIARRYGTTVRQLVVANDLADPDRIRAGGRLAVPGTAWLCPVEGAVRFTDDWGAGRNGGRRHLGIDLFARRGTPVVASVGGTVHHAPGARAGLAYYLTGTDGHTYYGAHLDELAPPGPVDRGQVIGRVGTTGNASETAPHLHFELKPGGGDPVNPYFTLDRWCR